MKTEDPVSIKQINTDRIRTFMEQEGSVSKSQIARQLGLSFPTVTRLLEELCSGGEVLTQGTGTSTGGRCACYYQLNPDYRLYLLIQVEEGRMRWSLKNLDEEPVEQAEVSFQVFSLRSWTVLSLTLQGATNGSRPQQWESQPWSAAAWWRNPKRSHVCTALT